MPDTLSSEEQRLARATKKLFEAAGGLKVCAYETGLSKSQLSRCSSPNHRDSLTARDTAAIEAITHGTPGHPHITRSLARIQGCEVICLPDAPESMSEFHDAIAGLLKEVGEAVKNAGEIIADGKVTRRECAAKGITKEIDDVIHKSVMLRALFEAVE